MHIRSLPAALATPRRRGATVVALMVLVGVVWWWFPTITGEAAGTDVVVVGDAFVWSAEREITYRVHEDGFSLVWAVQTNSWCDAPAAVRDAVDRERPEAVVVSFADDGTCDTDPATVRAQVAEAAGSARLIVIVNPATETTAPSPPGAVVVTASRLLGPLDALDQACLWWDDCRPDGRVEVRQPDGTLTPAGQTRVARLLVTALR